MSCAESIMEEGAWVSEHFHWNSGCSYSATSTATQQHLHADDTATRVESSAQNILLVLWKDPFGFVTAELTQNKENKSESRVALQRESSTAQEVCGHFQQALRISPANSECFSCQGSIPPAKCVVTTSHNAINLYSVTSICGKWSFECKQFINSSCKPTDGH